MSEETKRVRLKRLEIHNYQAVEFVAFDIARGCNDIAGRPAQGKSTIPQAIRELFTKGGVSSMPLRRGAADGLIRAEFDDGSFAEKKITAKGAQPTRRTDVDGKKTGIDSLAGWISEDVFNPLAFAALADSKAGRRAQAEIISEIAGLDTGKLDAERAQHLAAESAAGKAAEELEAQARGAVVPDAPAEIGEEREPVGLIDVVAIAGRKGEVASIIAAHAEERRKAKEAERAHEESAARAVTITEEIEALERKLEDLRGRSARAIDEMQAKWNRWQELAAASEKLVDPDTTTIDAEITAAREHNARIEREVMDRNRIARAAEDRAAERTRALAKRAEIEERARAKRTEERTAAGKKRAVDAAKAEAIANAARRMPIAGLSIEGEGADREVYMNGVPLSQASTMQKMQLGCSLALKRGVVLGLLWIDYGNELDERALEWLQGFLEEHNADAFVVHVVLDETKILEADGLIVEGGKVIADRRKTRKARAATEITVHADKGVVAIAAGVRAGRKAIEDLENVAAAQGVTPTDDEPPSF